jgi:serine/threonine protein kinase
METCWSWPFELLGKTGEGGMGVVYRARCVMNDKSVAVKLLPVEVSSDATLVARFEREMNVLKTPDHPHIAPRPKVPKSATSARWLGRS